MMRLLYITEKTGGTGRQYDRQLDFTDITWTVQSNS